MHVYEGTRTYEWSLTLHAWRSGSGIPPTWYTCVWLHWYGSRVMIVQPRRNARDSAFTDCLAGIIGALSEIRSDENGICVTFTATGFFSAAPTFFYWRRAQLLTPFSLETGTTFDPIRERSPRLIFNGDGRLNVTVSVNQPLIKTVGLTQPPPLIY